MLVAIAFGELEHLAVKLLGAHLRLEQFADRVRLERRHPGGRPQRLRIGQPLQAAAQLEIERHVGRRDRQQLGQRARAPVQQLGHDAVVK